MTVKTIVISHSLVYVVNIPIIYIVKLDCVKAGLSKPQAIV